MEPRELAIEIVGEPVLLEIRNGIKGFRQKVKIYRYRGFKIFIGKGNEELGMKNPLVCDADKIEKDKKDKEILKDFDRCNFHDLHIDNGQVWNFDCGEETLLNEMKKIIDIFWEAKREKIYDSSHGITFSRRKANGRQVNPFV